MTNVVRLKCRRCDDKGWLCEKHNRPYGAFSEREDACTCGDAVACFCNPDPKIDTRCGFLISWNIDLGTIKPRMM